MNFNVGEIWRTEAGTIVGIVSLEDEGTNLWFVIGNIIYDIELSSFFNNDGDGYTTPYGWSWNKDGHFDPNENRRTDTNLVELITKEEYPEYYL